MLRRFNNGLGIVALAIIMAVTPLVPAAVSATPPNWVWDSDGKVFDSTGQYVRVEGETKQPLPLLYPDFNSDGVDSSGGGCK